MSKNPTTKNGIRVLTSEPFSEFAPEPRSFGRPAPPPKSKRRCPECGALGRYVNTMDQGTLYHCGQCRRQSWTEAT